MKSLRLILLLAAVLLLAACATPAYVTDQKLHETLRTDDPAEQARRFGILATLAKSSWYNPSPFSVRSGVWEIPGVHLKVNEFTCEGGRCRIKPFHWFYDATEKRIAWHCASVYDAIEQSCHDNWYVGYVQPDGAVQVVPTSFVADKEHVLRLASNKRYVGPWLLITQEEGLRTAQEYSDRYMADVQENERKRSEFWGGVGQALLAGTQAYAQVATEHAQTQNELAQSRLQATQIASSQREAARRTAPNSVNSPAVPSANTSRAQVPAVRPSTVIASREPAPSEGPKRNAYPEAIVVCTIPNEKGLFKCANPIHEISGSKDNSLPEYRSPERMLASFKSSCWEPRKLPSSTHLVWACGYGATGGVDHKDQGGPGVDAKGRKTFYCYERESGCRRSAP